MIFQKIRHFFHHDVASFFERNTTTWVLSCSLCETDHVKNLTGRDKSKAIAFWNRSIELFKEGKI